MSCPNINLLKSYKVYPSQVDFRYQAHKFFVYIYLNPFEEFTTPYTVNSKKGELCFGMQPIYVGKGTGQGYRHNAHIKAFQNKRENNKYKIEAFQKIQDEMANAAATGDHSKPWNWDEYRKGYVKIVSTFNDPKELLQYETHLIKEIGTKWNNTGPLSNKIRNAYKFDGLSSGPIDPF